MSLLSAEGVSHGYPRRAFFRSLGPRVLSGVSLGIAPGETLGLLGRSGCGKSSLARLLTGLETPLEGSVCFQGTPLSSLDKPGRLAFRRQVQMVFQDPQGAVNPRLRVGDIIEEPLIHLTGLSFDQRAPRTLELLDAVDLPRRFARRYPFELSGGQLQRVCIARALAPGPSLIVLDEAVSNLDLHLQIQMLELFARLRREHGVAFLFVTHDLRLVERFCSRVLVMASGQVVEERAVTSPLTLESLEGRALCDAVLPAFPARLRPFRERLANETVS